MKESTPEQMQVIRIFMDSSKNPEQTCSEVHFEGCLEMKKEYLAEINKPGGCSSCRKASVRRKYTSFIMPRIQNSD